VRTSRDPSGSAEEGKRRDKREKEEEEIIGRRKG
jgi:hypothetical protein